jgi:hypothetical protein
VPLDVAYSFTSCPPRTDGFDSLLSVAPELKEPERIIAQSPEGSCRSTVALTSAARNGSCGLNECDVVEQ